jgi:hypothetical protein
MNNKLEHIVKEIIMLRTVTNRVANAVSTAPRVALCAWLPTPRGPIAVHWAGAARLARRRRALGRAPFGSGSPPPRGKACPSRRAGRAAAWRHVAAIALALRPCSQHRLQTSLRAASERRAIFGYDFLTTFGCESLTTSGKHFPTAPKNLCHFWLRILNHVFGGLRHFWLGNRNHVLRSLRHFWLRILNHFLAGLRHFWLGNRNHVLRSLRHFWLGNRNHLLRSLRHFWLRIFDHLAARSPPFLVSKSQPVFGGI